MKNEETEAHTQRLKRPAGDPTAGKKWRWDSNHFKRLVLGNKSKQPSSKF